MRLWHKDFINVLPRKQLIAQWRECCCIAKHIAQDGTPNHPLVNKVLDYPNDFISYTNKVIDEMQNRGYDISRNSYLAFCNNMQAAFDNGYVRPQESPAIYYSDLFKEWHNERYMYQCYYNLQEKYDCGMMDEDEWLEIRDRLFELNKPPYLKEDEKCI